MVFTQCTSENAYGVSESHRLWSHGILWDEISWTSASAGTVLGMHNFGYQHGWSGTESVAWNISAPGKILRCQEPPLGQHYAIGCEADIRKGIYPRGFVEGTGETIGIPSLYEAQLAERLKINYCYIHAILSSSLIRSHTPKTSLVSSPHIIL